MRAGRNGKENIPEVAEIIRHYRAVCVRRIGSKGWVDYRADGAALWRLFFKEKERPVLAWLISEHIDQYFAVEKLEKSTISLSYMLAEYEKRRTQR